MARAEGLIAALITLSCTLKPFRCQANSEAGIREKALPSEAIWAMLCSAGFLFVFHRNAASFQETVQTVWKKNAECIRTIFRYQGRMRIMSGRKRAGTGGRTVFTLVLEDGFAKARKKSAPAARAHADKRRKTPRRRPDFLAEA